MENNNNYRIVERLGYFTIQEQIIEKEEINTFWTRVLPFIFKPKFTISYRWKNIYDDFNFFVPKNFKTKEKAIEYISKLEPKYHYLEKIPEFPKDRHS